MSRILAIDFGEKRCGIAQTDMLRIAAHPLKVVPTKELLETLKQHLIIEDVEKIVFGKPLHPDGNPTFLWNKINDFSQKLQNIYPDLIIDFQDESYTSAQAQQIMIQSGMKKKERRKKENLDLISAILILQRYLGHI